MFPSDSGGCESGVTLLKSLDARKNRCAEVTLPNISVSFFSKQDWRGMCCRCFTSAGFLLKSTKRSTEQRMKPAVTPTITSVRCWYCLNIKFSHRSIIRQSKNTVKYDATQNNSEIFAMLTSSACTLRTSMSSGCRIHSMFFVMFHKLRAFGYRDFPG